MLSAEDLRLRILRGGDDENRRALFERFFSRGAPRKLQRAAEHIDLEGMRVLDIGCGYGVYLAHFSAQSLGLDRSPERVEFARSIGLRAELCDVEARDWTAGLGPFDRVWLCDILVHLADPQAFLASLHALLAPDARLVITEWLWPENRRLAALLARAVPGGREVLDNVLHLHRFSARSIAALLASAGFLVEMSYNHTFTNAAARVLSSPIWPPRTIIARAARTTSTHGSRSLRCTRISPTVSP